MLAGGKGYQSQKKHFLLYLIIFVTILVIWKVEYVIPCLISLGLYRRSNERQRCVGLKEIFVD